MQDGIYLWNCVTDMTLASYLHPQPKADAQVKRMAKRYLREMPKHNKLARRTLRTVVKTNQPAKLVQIAYDELVGYHYASLHRDQ